MAVFGVPHRVADHADRALSAALSIQECVGRKLDGWVDIGMGLDSGTVLAAIVGGGDRRDLTLVGNAVNTAAHVEAATRETGDTILLTERTRELLTDQACELDARLVKVSGRRRTSPALPRAGRPRWRNRPAATQTARQHPTRRPGTRLGAGMSFAALPRATCVLRPGGRVPKTGAAQQPGALRSASRWWSSAQAMAARRFSSSSPTRPAHAS